MRIAEPSTELSNFFKNLEHTKQAILNLGTFRPLTNDLVPALVSSMPQVRSLILAMFLCFLRPPSLFHPSRLARSTCAIHLYLIIYSAFASPKNNTIILLPPLPLFSLLFLEFSSFQPSYLTPLVLLYQAL